MIDIKVAESIGWIAPKATKHSPSLPFEVSKAVAGGIKIAWADDRLSFYILSEQEAESLRYRLGEVLNT